MLSNRLNDLAVVWHLVNCIAKWPQKFQTARSLTHRTIPNLTPQNLTLIWQVVTL